MRRNLSKEFVASHELTLSSSCLLIADSIDNMLMTFSVASYDKISSDQKVNEEKDVKGTSENPGQCMHNRHNALTDLP